MGQIYIYIHTHIYPCIWPKASSVSLIDQPSSEKHDVCCIIGTRELLMHVLNRLKIN